MDIGAITKIYEPERFREYRTDGWSRLCPSKKELEEVLKHAEGEPEFNFDGWYRDDGEFVLNGMEAAIKIDGWKKIDRLILENGADFDDLASGATFYCMLKYGEKIMWGSIWEFEPDNWNASLIPSFSNSGTEILDEIGGSVWDWKWSCEKKWWWTCENNMVKMVQFDLDGNNDVHSKNNYIATLPFI